MFTFFIDHVYVAILHNIVIKQSQKHMGKHMWQEKVFDSQGWDFNIFGTNFFSHAKEAGNFFDIELNYFFGCK